MRPLLRREHLDEEPDDALWSVELATFFPSALATFPGILVDAAEDVFRRLALSPMPMVPMRSMSSL